jgi:hypothetical protein
MEIQNFEDFLVGMQSKTNKYLLNLELQSFSTNLIE